MKLSKKSRYGLRALIDLAVHSANSHVSLNSIAERNAISPQYLEQVFSDEDWGNYRTLVHALKSTSLTIGAVHLSGQAKELETAAKNGDADYIRSHHKAVLEEYIELIGGIREILDLFLC